MFLDAVASVSEQYPSVKWTETSLDKVCLQVQSRADLRPYLDCARA